MNMKGLNSHSFRFHDRRQKRIYERLALVGEGPAAFYRDACRIIATEPPFETTTHLVGHCLREIESALRSVLKPAVGNTTLSNGSKKNVTGEERHKHDITIILQGLDIPETDPIAQLWLRLPGQKS